jgi:hypothetical protein
MNKGCLIAVGVFFGIVILCCGGVIFYAMKNGNPLLVTLIETDIASYRKAHPEVTVEPVNEAWAQILADPAHKLEGQPLWDVWVKEGQGKLIDIYRNPVRLEPQSDGAIRVVSNGKDGLPNTPDDESSLAPTAQ